MIRHFYERCKLLYSRLTDEAIFVEATESFSHHGERCPNCGAEGKLTPHSSYSRHLVSYEDGTAVDRLVWPLRFECGSCDATHALLPHILVPYSPYSLRFKLLVMIAYFERDTTVAAVCARFGIAVATLYAWKERLLEHKGLMLGAVASQKEPSLAFLRGLFSPGRLPDAIHDFFRKHAFSFMQGRTSPATRSRPP
jgi:hypothetical protein